MARCAACCRYLSPTPPFTPTLRPPALGGDFRAITSAVTLKPLVAPAADSAAGRESDDFGAGEWAAIVEAAAARAGLIPDQAAELVGAGYSPRLADMLTTPADNTELVPVRAGSLTFAPDAGAGAGLRPSVAARLGDWSEAIRAVCAARVAAATTGAAKAAAAAAAGRAESLLTGLLSLAAGGSGPRPDMVAEFFAPSAAAAADDGTAMVLTTGGRKRAQRLRELLDEAGVHCGEATPSAAALAHSPVYGRSGRRARVLPSIAGDELWRPPVSAATPGEAAERERARLRGWLATHQE